MTPGPDELLDLAVELATSAGRLALAGRRSVHEMASDAKSSPTDAVTEWDRRAEAHVVEVLARRRPDDAVVGEEGAAHPGTSGVEWLVDPIDGTTNFVYDLPSWCTSIAAAVDGVVVAGAVFAPVVDELFTASAGGGARRNGTPIRASGCTDLGLALLATGFAYDPARRRQQAELLVGVLPHVRDIRRLGSAAIDLCHAACGRVDAYVEAGLNPWDSAAGLLIAHEAGCASSDRTGAPVGFDDLVVCAPAIHADLLALLRRAEPAVG
ncbi:MAG: inositol monophosphatase [Ilumatobacteraceae bacterium]|jgi:myo-inositol-1(or 4)-monophosphatase|nr:inositol monophosphatase [Ilumatobacteraceae bacterium]